MNRRQLFKYAFAAGLLVPATKFFLPPAGGWRQWQLSEGFVREVEQYVINVDQFYYRYDAVGRDIWGAEHQIYTQVTERVPIEQARSALEMSLRHHGLTAVRPGEGLLLRLPLPRTGIQARYL